MQLTREQYALIEHLLPVQRGNVSIDNLTLLNAILYVAVNGCTWRGLPAEYGRWHTVYTRMSRWAKAGILDTVFEELQMLQLLKARIEVASLDSTNIKVHPDGTGALKNAAPKPSAASAVGSTPRFIWLPRASSRSSASA
jgi:transposase